MNLHIGWQKFPFALSFGIKYHFLEMLRRVLSQIVSESDFIQQRYRHGAEVKQLLSCASLLFHTKGLI